eukprot:GHVR01128209.1.p1 GENE.GHVR01128209.1~~GHVR01128209.1.p1  ORF type:complete len:523 (+),score=110.21 GHVR01128209.1:268-1836(+)
MGLLSAFKKKLSTSRIIYADINMFYKITPVVIGTGGSGPVKLGIQKETNKKVAIKQFSIRGAKPVELQLLRNEAEIYLKLDHPHIAKLLEVYEDESRVYLVMENCAGSELYRRLCRQKVYSEYNAAEAIRQMLDTVAYLHHHSIVHRDLKLENWLYESDKPDSPLKLIDFGFSRVWNPSMSVKMHATCGSVAYVSPDTLSGSYNNKCDIWSMGVHAYMLLIGSAPFWGANDDETIKKIISGKYPTTGPRWEAISPLAKDFVSKLLELDPEKRLSAREALSHPWMRCEAPKCHIGGDVVDSLKTFASSTHFRRAALILLAYSLTYDEIEGMGKIFLSLDEGGEGAIQYHELSKVLTENFHMNNDEISCIFNSLDPHGESEVRYTHFVAALMHTRVLLHQDLIKRAFNKIDVAGTGYITASDLKDVLDYHDGLSVEDILKEAQFCPDGVIEYEEFLARILSSGHEREGCLDTTTEDPLLDDELLDKNARLLVKLVDMNVAEDESVEPVLVMKNTCKISIRSKGT